MTIEDVRAIASSLAEVSEGERHGTRTSFVAAKAFAWERGFSKADIRRFGDAPVPDGPILAVRVADLGEKEAVLAQGERGFFTIPHFEGYPAVLIELNKATKRAVKRALIEAWLACAPDRLVQGYLSN